MEAVAALSLACNVIQIIGVGNKAIEVIYQTYRYGSSIDNVYLEEITQQLQSLISTSPVTTNPQLQQVADNCQKTSQQLINELSFLKGKGKRDAIKKGFLAIRKRGEIEKLKANLADQERLLNTSVLLRLKEDCDATAITLQSDFRHLDKSLQQFIENLTRGNIQVQTILTAEVSSIQQRVSIEHENTRAFFKDVYTRTVTEQQREKFLRSLKFPLMNARRNQISSHYPQTFEWIFESHSRWTSFPDWLKHGVDTYFVEGKAASGKSTLVKFIAEDPRTRTLLYQWAPAAKVVSHYFWLAGELLQRNLQGLFLSLVYQLLLENDNVLVEELASEKEEPSDWSLAELLKLFRKLTASEHCCIFLDGLDECGDDPETLTDLLEELVSQSNIKLCVSSRPDKFYLNQVHPYSMIRLQELTRADIQRYIVSRLTEAQKRGQLISAEGQDAIVNEMVIKADGVFLWVCLALNSVLRGIRSQASLAELQMRIAQLPDDVVKLYENMLDRMENDWPSIRVEAALYFKVFMCPALGGYYKSRYQGSGARLYQYAVILNRMNGICESQLTGNYFVDEVYRVAHRITSVCAGFLDIERPMLKDDHDWLISFKTGTHLRDSLADSSRRFNNFAHLAVVCTHRTAHDFLIQQPKGQSLMEACSISDFEIWRFSLEARELFMRRSGTTFSWADVVNVVLELNKMETQGILQSSSHTFDALNYIRACFVARLQSLQQQRLEEDYSCLDFRKDYLQLKPPNHVETGPNHHNVHLERYAIDLPTYPYKQICAVDFMGLTLEAARPEYFQHVLEPYFQRDSRHNPLRQEYLDYLLLCASRSHYRFLFGSDRAGANAKIEAVTKLLLGAGANAYAEFFLPHRRVGYNVRWNAATHLLYGYKALASTPTGLDAQESVPQGFLAFMPPDSSFSIGDSRFNLSARVYMKINVPYRSADHATGKDTHTYLISETLFAANNIWQLEKRIVLVSPAQDVEDAWKVSSQESLELLSFIDRWRSAKDSDLNDVDHMTYKAQFSEMVDKICVRSEHVNVEQYLRQEGYLKDSTDPAVTQGAIQRFKDGIDASKMPHW